VQKTNTNDSISLSIHSGLSAFLQGKGNTYYIHGEWETHDAVWLGWAAVGALRFYSTVNEVIQTLTPQVTAKLASDSDGLMQSAKNYLHRQNIDRANIQFYTLPGDRYWIRDHGAAFLVNEKGDLGVADLGWNLYGHP